MPEERRTDYPKILETITEIKIDLAKVVALTEERNNSALLWRTEVCKKFEGIKSYCALRQEHKQRVWLAIIGVVIVGLVGWGEVKRQVDINTKDIDMLEKSH
jgi:hypothetical protein